MSRHVMECLGLSRVTIEDGKVVGVTEPVVRYCPLFAKHRGIEELNEESVRENIEYRIRTFGMCSENRETAMKDFLSFGISETLSTALTDGEVDAVVLAADGCGTCVVTDPALVQGLGGRISAIRETEPIPKVVEAVGRSNMLDPDTAAIDMVAGAEKAFAMGYDRIAVTTASVRDAERIRDEFGDRAVIALVHTTGISEKDADRAFRLCDLITACASKYLREMARSRRDIIQAGSAVPVYGVTDIGRKLMLRRLEIAGKKPWDPSQKEDPPQPLLRSITNGGDSFGRIQKRLDERLRRIVHPIRPYPENHHTTFADRAADADSVNVVHMDLLAGQARYR